MSMRATPRGFRRASAPVLLCALLLLAVPLAANAAAVKTVRYGGVALRVPARWPVFNLARARQTCVRFNRHAVYLGEPGAVERCPVSAVGRTEAILVSPAGGAGAGVAGSPGSVVRGTDGVTVTATWGSRPALVRRALGALWRGGSAQTGAFAHAAASPSSGGVGVGATGPVGSTGVSGTTGATGATTPIGPIVTGPQTIYTGLGFDVCQDPSPTALSAWLASPYRAVGTYIGGTNMGCSQPNLSAAYVSAEIAAGWHLIPTYVGLQAPSNSCGCKAITASEAAAEGTAAADDAVANAQAVGIGSGNPIYYDMEAYPSKPSITATVLTFLSAWTTELHALGYHSGVYSSADSGIKDLVAAVGGTYLLPDDLWDAEWNGTQSTATGVIPSTEWSNHQRLHQYQGAHDEKYGGVQLNIDGDYLDGGTVGSISSPAPVPSTPVLTIAPQTNGAIELNGSWSGQTGVSSWQLLGGSDPAALQTLGTPLASGRITTHSSFPYFAVKALGSAGQVLGMTVATATPAHLAIYGHSVFAPATGWAGVPVGCFTGTTCHLAVTVSVGRTVLARTKPERVASGTSGLVYFALTTIGHRLLSRAAGDKLPVTVTIRDSAGTNASAPMTLIGFTTTGRGPARSATQGTALRVVGLQDFVAGGGYGGILAECVGAGPCQATATLSAGRTVLARTGSEFMGANELSYLSFRLTPQARSLLSSASGGMLGAHLKLTETGDAATANIALVRF